MEARPRTAAGPLVVQVVPAAKPAVYVIDRPESIQSVVLAGHVAPPKASPDEPASESLKTLLGGAFTSRINMNIREDKHWSYGAGSFLPNARSQRPFLVYAPVQTDKTKETMQELERELGEVDAGNPFHNGPPTGIRCPGSPSGSTGRAPSYPGRSGTPSPRTSPTTRARSSATRSWRRPRRALGQYGAEVIKVEVPYQGDYWRGGTYWGKYWKHSNPLWHFINHSKYFVAIDVKKPKGKDLILKLAETADVVIENFTSGTVEAWGIGYSQVSKINPKVVYASLSTYGQSGPLRFFPGWDLLAQGASGVLSITGYPETEKYFKVPDFFGDFFPGYFAPMLMLIALNYREKTGEGQYLDICQAEILMRALFHFTHLGATGEEIGRTGNMDPTMAPSGIFKTKDGKGSSLWRSPRTGSSARSARPPTARIGPGTRNTPRLFPG